MKVLILEDEFLSAGQLTAMIIDYDPSIEVVAILESVESAVEWLNTHSLPDLLFADIELADGQSFLIFEQVEVTCPVILTTAYDEFALRAFKVHSIDYLLKPINEEALKKSLLKFSELKKLYGTTTREVNLQELASLLRQPVLNKEAYRDRFLLKQGSRLLPIEVGEIAYFYTKERLSFVKTWDNKILTIDYHLDELEAMLNPKQFYRANRQFIICSKSVSKIHLHFQNRLKVELHPQSEMEVYVSRDKATEFRSWMGE